MSSLALFTQQHYLSKVYFLWLSHSSTHFSDLSFNVVREICLYLASLGGLVSLTKDTIRCYSCDAHKWTPSLGHHPMHIEKNSSQWVLISDSRVFVCGGAERIIGQIEYFRSAYLIDLEGNITKIEAMKQARAFHGVIFLQNSVYVFGGKGPACVPYLSLLASSEVYEVGKGWRDVQSMYKGRCCFNPCLYRRQVYLCGFGSERMESYSVLSNTVDLLPYILPEAHPCCLIVHHNSLFIHSANYVCQLTESSPQPQFLTRRTQISQHKHQNSQPVLDPSSGLVYCVSAETCYSFELYTGKTVAVPC